MSTNPAYEQVTLKSITVQDNSAYSIVHSVPSPAVPAKYECIVGVQNKTNEYEDVDLIL